MTPPEPVTPADHRPNGPPPPMAALVASALGVLLVAWSLAGLSLDRTPTEAAGAANLRALGPWWLACAAGWTALTWLAVVLTRPSGADGGPAGGFVRPALAVLLVGAAGRAAIVATHAPTLSDDLHRYVLDGRTLAAGASPYAETPAERLAALARGAPERFDGEAALVPLVNNPDLHTIYLPASQFVFAAIGELIEAGPGAWSTPAGSGRVLRAVLVAVDLGVVGLVLVGLARAGRSPWWAALYAWHPLVLSEVAGSGHQDVLGVAALVAALLLWTGTASTGRRAAGTLVLAGATLVKPVAVLLGPVVARDRPAPNWPAPNLPAQTWIGHGLLGAAGIAALTVGLGLAGGLEGIEHLLETARRFTGKWAHFGAVYETSQWGLETLWPVEDPEVQWRRREAIERAGRVICGLVVIVGAALVLRRPWRTPGGAIDGRWPWAATGRLMLLLVLASTTAHPWYLLWALAAVPVAGSPAIWVASLTVPLGYAALGDPADWTVPGWLLAAAWAPVAAALAVELRAGRHRRSVAASPGHRSAPPPPEQPPEARSPSP